MLCSLVTPTKIPYFNAPIYLSNKTQIGKVDEILGPINEVYFTVKMGEGMLASSFKKEDKVYIGGDKLLPIDRFLPKPKTPGGDVKSGSMHPALEMPSRKTDWVVSQRGEERKVPVVEERRADADEGDREDGAHPGVALAFREGDREEVSVEIGVDEEVPVAGSSAEELPEVEAGSAVTAGDVDEAGTRVSRLWIIGICRLLLDHCALNDEISDESVSQTS
ncbi:H/ACA ribonucleoprotein complex subunit 1, partial [Tremellales sp. Uapishka_1]